MAEADIGAMLADIHRVIRLFHKVREDLHVGPQATNMVNTTYVAETHSKVQNFNETAQLTGGAIQVVPDKQSHHSMKQSHHA